MKLPRIPMRHFGAAIVGATPLWANPLSDSDLTELSLAELLDIKVTVATAEPRSSDEVPAAVYVITGDEIRRAGHSSVQEALRMVPGFYVSHWTNSRWDVTARGFGTGLSSTTLAYHNQLLVMIDGVVVYTPLFPGTSWALHDVDLADVDRIEVVRGPGGSVWGANSEHGVVHIITKKASDTQGVRVGTWQSSDERHYSGRYGGSLGEDGSYRIWFESAHYETPANPFEDFPIDFSMRTGGFRADWQADSGQEMQLWGRIYDGKFRNIGFDLDTFDPFSALDRKKGGQLAFQLHDPESGSSWRASYLKDRQDIVTLVDIEIDVFDVEYRREIELGERTELTVGLGYQRVESELVGDDPFYLAFDPESETQNNLRAFVLDTIDFPDQDLELTLALQAIHNEFSDFDLAPSARLLWRPREQSVGWAAVTRAVRTPSLEEVSLTEDSIATGSSSFSNEELLAFEIGWRESFAKNFSLDFTAFYNDYDELHSTSFDEDTFIDQISNGAEGESIGAELAVEYEPCENWRLRGAYAFIDSEYELEADGTTLPTDDQSPQHIWNLRSYYDLGSNWELDGAIYAVDRLGSDFDIAEYTRGDLRIGYRPSDSLRLSLGVQGINDPERSEFDEFDNIRRTVFFAMSWMP